MTLSNIKTLPVLIVIIQLLLINVNINLEDLQRQSKELYTNEELPISIEEARELLGAGYNSYDDEVIKRLVLELRQLIRIIININNEKKIDIKYDDDYNKNIQ